MQCSCRGGRRSRTKRMQHLRVPCKDHIHGGRQRVGHARQQHLHVACLAQALCRVRPCLAAVLCARLVRVQQIADQHRRPEHEAIACQVLGKLHAAQQVHLAVRECGAQQLADAAARKGILTAAALCHRGLDRISLVRLEPLCTIWLQRQAQRQREAQQRSWDALDDEKPLPATQVSEAVQVEHASCKRSAHHLQGRPCVTSPEPYYLPGTAGEWADVNTSVIPTVHWIQCSAQPPPYMRDSASVMIADRSLQLAVH